MKMTQWNQLQKTDLSELQSLLQSGNDTVVDEAFQSVTVIRDCESVVNFLCVTYPDKALDNICTDKLNNSHSMLCKFANSKMELIEPILTALEPHLACYMTQNPLKKETFLRVLNACIIIICGRKYPDRVAIESFDAMSIVTIEILKRFGACPGENTDNPNWYTHTYDNILEKLIGRSTHFIEYMSTNVNYRTCRKKEMGLFELLLEASPLAGDRSHACTSLAYLIAHQHFDPTECHYADSSNPLHHIRRIDVLSLILPLIDAKKCLWQQPNNTGKTPVDVHIQSKEFIAAFQQYDAIPVEEYVAKKTSGEWLSAYKSRKKLHSYDCDYSYMYDKKDYIDPLTIDEIHVKKAYTLLPSPHEYISYFKCVGCYSRLPENAYCVNHEYYCSLCIKTDVLVPFCSKRLSLLYEIETLPRDLIRHIIKCVVFLSFDHAQIQTILCEKNDLKELRKNFLFYSHILDY